MAVLIPHCPAGKILVTITALYDGYALALDQDGVHYFIFHTAIEHTSPYQIDDVRIGTQVYGTPIRHPKGWRLIEVQVREI